MILFQKIHQKYAAAIALLLSVGVSVGLSFVGSVSAQTAATQLPNPLQSNSVQGILYLIANTATYIGAIVAVLALIFVGFKFVAARGNPEKITEAKTFLFYVIVGIAILIGATAIVDVIKNTLTSAGVVQPGVFGSSN